MADTQTTVVNLDIQLLDESRADTTTFKLDNPKSNVTREQVSAAMQPALTNGWLLTTKGNVAMYLGDITINQSIKTKLGGEDFYVTPTAINWSNVGTEETEQTGTITCSGATIQGYRFENFNELTYIEIEPSANISANGLSITIKVSFQLDVSMTTVKILDLVLIIQGAEVTIPVNASK